MPDSLETLITRARHLLDDASRLLSGQNLPHREGGLEGWRKRRDAFFSESARFVPAVNLVEQQRLADVGAWFEEAFVCRFGPEYAAPLPQGPMLLGSRMRLQRSSPDGGWMTLMRVGTRKVGHWVTEEPVASVVEGSSE